MNYIKGKILFNSFKYLIIFAFLATFTISGYASTNYQCSVTPKDNIHIKTSQVEVYGPNGTLIITPEGNISRNGVALSVSASARSQAKNYQSQLRKDLPYIYKGATQQINDFHNALDVALAKKFGTNSKTRAHLQELKSQLNVQLNRVLTPTKEGMTFDAQAIKLVEKESQSIIQRKLGAIVQDGINEMGSQGLQGLLGGLDDLQGSMQKVMQKQIQSSSVFASQACSKARALEDQKQSLMRILS